MLTADVDDARIFHQMTVEITQMLITAGSEQNVAELKWSIKSALRLLMKYKIIRYPMKLLDSSYACAYSNQLKLHAELIQILVKYETCRMGSAILQTAVDIVDIRDMVAPIVGDIDPYNEMIDSLGDMFRYFYQARADQVTDRLQIKMGPVESILMKAFIVIAGYSSQPGCSKKLFRAIMSALNADTVNRLKRGLYKKLQAMDTSTPVELRTITHVAFNCLKNIVTPFRLEGLCRLEIRRALSNGTMNNESLKSNVIPVHVKEFVLHQE